MKLLTVVATLASLAASVSGFNSYRPLEERDVNRKTHLPVDAPVQVRGYSEDALLARWSFEKRTALFDNDDAIYRRALLDGYVALIGRAAANQNSPSPGPSSATGPTLPAGKDATKLHVWTRLDTRPTEYDDRGGASHDGLNQLMKDTGGRHVDVIVGSPSSGFQQYGLKFAGRDWMQKPNGDEAEVEPYNEPYKKTAGEGFKYIGQLDGRSTFNSVKTKG